MASTICKNASSKFKGTCQLLRSAVELVCLETALPCEPRPSIAFVAGTWFAAKVSQRGLQAVKDGSTDRSPGGLGELLALLAVLDFLTSESSGLGRQSSIFATATRMVTLKACQECLAKVELQLIFGPPEAKPVRATGVMRLLQLEGEEALLRMLQKMLPKQASRKDFEQLQEPVQLLLAAAQCLFSEDEEESLRRVLETLRLESASPVSSAELKAAFGDTSPLLYMGVELYRSGVEQILACFSSWTGYFAFDEELQQHDIKGSVTILETSAVSCYDSSFGETRLLSACPHASCVQELRRHIGQRLLEHRFERLGGRFLHHGGPTDQLKERKWNRLFDSVDSDHNEKISMEEWWKAMEDDCNVELRELFQFENVKMKKLVQKLFKSSVHAEAESSLSREDFVLACRMAEQDELMWHFVYMIADHEMESADDRSAGRSGATTKEDLVASIVNWNRHNIEEGLEKEHSIFATYSDHLGVWKRLSQSPLEAWSKHCAGIRRRLKEIEEAVQSQDFVYLPGCDDTEEVLRGSFSEQLFVKVAFSKSKSRQDVAIFTQLILLQCHVMESVWRSLFPKRCQQATREVVEQCPDLWLGIDYVFSKHSERSSRAIFFSPQGFQKWRNSDKWREISDRQETLHQRACQESRSTESDCGTREVVQVATDEADTQPFVPRQADHLCSQQSEDDAVRSGSHQTNSDILGHGSASNMSPTSCKADTSPKQPETTMAHQLSRGLEAVHQPHTPTYWRDLCQTVYPAKYPANLFAPAAEEVRRWRENTQEHALDAGSYLQADAAIHLQCEVLDKRGVLATSPEGPCREFQDVLAAFTGYRPEDLCVQAMGCVRPDTDVIVLKAEICPANTSIREFRAMQQRHLIKTAESSREFFQKFPANGDIHVSTSCCIDNQGGPSSTALAGCRSYSHLAARMDILEPADVVDSLPSDRVQEVLSQLSLLGLPEQVQVLRGASGTRRLHFNLRPRVEAPTLEDMRTLQTDLVELEARGLPHLLGNSMVVESTLHHLPAAPACGNSTLLRCHLDITDESGWLHQHGGHRCASEFVHILKKIASHYNLMSLEFKNVRMWQLKSKKDYTMDFQVLAPISAESRTIHQLIWSLHQKGLADWAAVDASEAIFRGVTVKRPARVFATSSINSGECHSWQLSQPSQESKQGFMVWEELEVVDRFGAIQRNGATHLVALLADSLHVITGIESARVSILNVSPRSDLPKRTASREGPALVYSVKLEIDFSSCVAHEQNLRSVLEATSNLHSTAVLRRWGHLPFFQQYFIIGVVVHEAQTCDQRGEREWKLVSLERDLLEPQPKVLAHLDLRSKVGNFHCSHGRFWPLRLADMLAEALHQACGVAKNDIVITCIQLRPASQQRSGLVTDFLEAMEKLELEAKAASDSDDEDVRDGFRRGLSEIFSDASSASYTVEFEVMAHSMHDVAAELTRLCTSLRKFHSQAVRRRFAALPFFQEFAFDVGLQLFRSSSCHIGGASSKPLEQHMLPRRMSAQCSPVVLAGPCVQSRLDTLEDFIVLDGYANIIQRGTAPSEYGPPVAESQIQDWFLEALQYHLQAEKLEALTVPDVRGTSLTIRPPDSSVLEPFHFDGLWLRVTGIRSRAAHTEKIQQRVLKPAQVGAEAATVASGFLAYAVDFEVRRLGESTSVPKARYAALAEQVRAVLHGCLLHLHRTRALKKKLKFYRHFEFDRGIQLDSIRYKESQNSLICSPTHCAPWEASFSTNATHHSSTPRTFAVSVRFHSVDSTKSPPTASSVKTGMAALLGLEHCQLEAVEVEMKASWFEAQLTIRTLSHSPAVEEVEALSAKLASLHHNGVCSASCSEQLGSWKPVAVVAPALDEDRKAELAVAIQLQLLPSADSVWPGRPLDEEEVRLELEKQTGFDGHRLQLTNLRQSSSCANVDFAILGLWRERATLLKAFWDAAVQSKIPKIKHWSGSVVDVKVLDAAQLRGRCSTGPTRSLGASEEMTSKLGLREAIKDYIHLCRTGGTGTGNQDRQCNPYPFRLLKHILDMFVKIEAPEAAANSRYAFPASERRGAARLPKHHLAQHGVASSLLQDFSSVLLEVVELHGKMLGSQTEHAMKEYFLSQDWRPEEMRYALRALTWVLAYDTSNAEAYATYGRPSSPTSIQAALSHRAVGLAEAIRVYQKFLGALEEEDLSRGIYRPCSMLQNLLLALQGIQSKPCDATLPAWLAGTDFLDDLGRVLERSGYRMAYGHAVALVFQVATQMTCKAYVARMDFPRHTAVICENVNKLMKVMQMWSSINQHSNATWSMPLQEAMDTSLPEFVELLERLLPSAHARSPVEKLKEWTRTPSDNIKVIHDLMSSPPPRPIPAFCKCEV
ncbi:ACP5 [Symbiodinium natans]|uniref:ACP5 protein n=1 Tax=Symbiodinium natans TaxID=878477 RepID=A0A812HMD0_9DINO|nr:ACP5 [Symbiodinium natans]